MSDMDELAQLRAALLPFAEQRAGVDDLLTARRVLGLPDFPPVNQAMAELRETVGGAFDGVDADAYVREMREDAELAAAHAEIERLTAERDELKAMLVRGTSQRPWFD